MASPKSIAVSPTVPGRGHADGILGQIYSLFKCSGRMRDGLCLLRNGAVGFSRHLTAGEIHGTGPSLSADSRATANVCVTL